MNIRDFIWRYAIVACTDEPQIRYLVRDLFEASTRDLLLDKQVDPRAIGILVELFVPIFENCWRFGIESDFYDHDTKNIFKRLKNSVRCDLDTVVKRLI